MAPAADLEQVRAAIGKAAPTLAPEWCFVDCEFHPLSAYLSCFDIYARGSLRVTNPESGYDGVAIINAEFPIRQRRYRPNLT